MAYAISDILQWAEASQALSVIGETKNLALKGGSYDVDLHTKIYTERKSLEYAYAQDPSDDDTYMIGNWVLALLGGYLFESQNASGSGGAISAITPASAPDRIDFIVSASSFLPTGTTTYTFPAAWEGFNMDFIRGGFSQSQVNSEPSYFTWDRTTREFVCSPALSVGELVSLIPC